MKPKGVTAVPVYLVALLEALFYLSRVPVNLALAFDLDMGLKLGAGVSAFERRYARRRALKRLSSPDAGGDGPDARTVWRVLRRMRFERVELTGRVALGDAGLTALLCGALNGLACAAAGHADRVRSRVAPDFSNAFRLELRGMLRARTGQIIIAIIQIGKEALIHGKASH